MYQRCTSTTVNYGELRSLTVTRNQAVSWPEVDLPGVPSKSGRGLITRRSWVQIPPPPPCESPRSPGLGLLTLRTAVPVGPGVPGFEGQQSVVGHLESDDSSVRPDASAMELVYH